MNSLILASRDNGVQQTTIEAGRVDRDYWVELWKYRELFYVLAWRDVSVRYKQTVIGIAWALIRPFITMVVLTFVFAKLAKLPTEGNTPYAAMVFAAMLPWTLFSAGVTEASASLIGNGNLVSKVYFPRLIVPAATVLVALVDFGIGFVLMLLIMGWYGIFPGIEIILLPCFVLLAVAVTLGLGVWLSALNVQYRDFRYVIPFLLQLALYLSPVGFSSSLVPEQWRLLYYLNPMVGVIDGFRWCLLGGGTTMFWPGVGMNVVVCGFVLLLAVRRFRATEKTFADVI